MVVSNKHKSVKYQKLILHGDFPHLQAGEEILAIHYEVSLQTKVNRIVVIVIFGIFSPFLAYLIIRSLSIASFPWAVFVLVPMLTFMVGIFVRTVLEGIIFTTKGIHTFHTRGISTYSSQKSYYYSELTEVYLQCKSLGRIGLLIKKGTSWTSVGCFPRKEFPRLIGRARVPRKEFQEKRHRQTGTPRAR